MCGIAWIAGVPDDAAIGRMAAAISHRGPDALTTKTVGGCSIGHARLSIIDLVSGDQPKSDDSGRFWIAFNGEIYNYRALRSELAREGVQFHTMSDTEVLLEGWKVWGRGLLPRLRGMFAFAIWDEQERSLIAARDLFGEKPLYYAIAPNGSLLAASELKSILASGAVEPRISLTAVDAFLALGYIPPDRTVYENVFVLPPAHLLEWRGGPVRIERYWDLRFDTRSISLQDAAAELLRRTDQAVERQMVADVPVGAFLSGGLDSSTIVALMTRHTSEPVKTFSVGFGKEINELPYARAVARAYRTEHHEIDLGRPNVAELLTRMIDVYDEPFADTSNIPTFLISEYARRFVKVVLSGDGGDELFGGYAWYQPLLESETIRFARAQWLILRIVAKLQSNPSASLVRRGGGAGLAAASADMWERDIRVATVMRPRKRERLWGRKLSSPFRPGGLFRPPSDATGLNRAFYFDLTSYLPGDILVKVDRAAMAHGLETRAPFLDRDLVEFALTLPSALKVAPGRSKVVMNEAFRHLWPEELHGRAKQGFGSPVGSWMRMPEVAAMIQRVTQPSSALRALLPGVRESDVRQPNYAAWILLTLGLWLEKHPAGVAA
jgi:asparagine synthase (glutamine-hydrolysing)